MGVPEGWQLDTLGELSEVITKGTTPKTYGMNYTPSGIPFLRVENISALGKITAHTAKLISRETHNSLKRSQIRPGDILFSIAGALGRVALVPESLQEANINQAVAVVRLRQDSCLGSYLAHALRGDAVQTQVGLHKAALAQANLNLKQVAAIEVLLPPIWEQRKIAAILSSVDEAIEKTQAVIDQVQVVKKGLMQELLTRGLPGRHEKFKQTEIGELPAEWEVVQLGQVARITSGGTPDRSNPDYWGGSIPWVKTGEIKRCAIRGTSEHITDLGLNNSAAKIFPQGTVLMAMYGQGQTRGRVGWLEVPACTNQACAAIEPDPKISRRFVYHFLDHHYEAIRTIGNEGSQKNLNISLIKSISIPIMHHDEQRQIAALADAHDVRITAESMLLSGLQALKQSLMSNLLTGQIRVTP